MRLLVDIGNSRVKAAVENKAGLRPLPPLAYDETGLADVLPTWGRLDAIESCWVASVGHADLCEQVSDWTKASFGIQPVFPKSTAQACGITNAYAVPGNLGIDRWLAMIAAHAQSRLSTVVVSAGTAVTIDVLEASGQHLGGLIAPGLTTQRRAMLRHTQVRANTSNHHLELLGDSTDACVSLGTVHAVVGYIERVTRQLQQQQTEWRYLISGGDAEFLLPHLHPAWVHEPQLVLSGLAEMANNHD